MSVNEAAERLRDLCLGTIPEEDQPIYLCNLPEGHDGKHRHINIDGLADERRATVERIRAAVEELPQMTIHADPSFQAVGLSPLAAIFDAEAAR